MSGEVTEKLIMMVKIILLIITVFFVVMGVSFLAFWSIPAVFQ